MGLIYYILKTWNVYKLILVIYKFYIETCNATKIKFGSCGVRYWLLNFPAWWWFLSAVQGSYEFSIYLLCQIIPLSYIIMSLWVFLFILKYLLVQFYKTMKALFFSQQYSHFISILFKCLSEFIIRFWLLIKIFLSIFCLSNL